MYKFIDGVKTQMTEEEVKKHESLIAQQAEFEHQYWLNTPYKEAVNAIIRGTCPIPIDIPDYRTYDPSDEFAIIRQKDEKPGEYADYYESCEAAKAYARLKHEEAMANAGN